MSKILLISFLVIGIVGPCVAVVALGRWFQRRLSKKSPDSLYVRKMTPTGIILNMVFVLFLASGTAIGKLAPQSKIGAFLSTPTHMLLALFALWLLFTVTAAVASKFGHPMAKKKDRNMPKP
ncbi:hypothetical protein ACXU4B_11020 [Dyella soli]|uniref:Uncharacterized protein n=1 Tax=Dyella soli TaxID=522319 RepID=A0A4R0YNA4_9GAMM|nr:hypothetical protein [Dyella soli]TCI07299.1 hypothetical protein EZM97_32400 [Dyella soli]